MPISQTTNGLIYYDDLEEQGAWSISGKACLAPQSTKDSSSIEGLA
jgi:hypothetical protein